ncbi:MAG: hypothetical protein M3362_06630, partial [Acidobacteriota bacterium]|nr:hypothetical protein [Acidobacteriota bacterium]
MDKTKVTITHTQSPEEAASVRGYNDCKKSNKFDSASGIPESYYAPVAGYETQYQAGWDKAQEEEDKKTVRREGIGRLIVGASLLIIGIAGIVFTFNTFSLRGRLTGGSVMRYALG